jgi:hypothetical protein
MNPLCDAIRSQMAETFVGGPEWEVIPNGADACVARTPKVRIVFTRDRRDRLISSTITFVETPEEWREELQSYIIARLFPTPLPTGRTGGDPVSHRIALEVESVRNILEAIERQGLSPRDLYYFQRGYSSGYTDFASY